MHSLRRIFPFPLLLFTCGSACSQPALDEPPDPETPDLGTQADLRHEPYPFDWVGILGTGQSLSVGAASGPLLSPAPAGTPHRKLQYTGPTPCNPFGPGSAFAVAPLGEPIRPPLACASGGEYPDNIAGETPHTAFARQLSVLLKKAGEPELPTLHSVVGWSGQAIQFIDKAGGHRGYPAGLAEGAPFKQAAAAAGKRFGYGAVLLTHGESDSANPQYGAQVWQLAQDYDRDLQNLTGQSRGVPLLLSQQHTFPTGPGRSLSTVAQWRLGVDHPGQIICTGPKYQYPYAADKVHLAAANYVQLGQKYAQVFYEAAVLKMPWQPLQPTQAQRSGRTLTVRFHVPRPPLMWEESIPAPHQTSNVEWRAGRGFEVADASGSLTISAATLSASGDAVELLLDKEPTGSGLVVRYALTQAAAGPHGGDDQGRRGQLRDSDPFTGYDREALPCQVRNGVAEVMVTGSLAARAVKDLVAADKLPPGTRITAMGAGNKLTLSKPWEGATGTAELSFWHDQYNYAVAFEMAVK